LRTEASAPANGSTTPAAPLNTELSHPVEPAPVEIMTPLEDWASERSEFGVPDFIDASGLAAPARVIRHPGDRDRLPVWDCVARIRHRCCKV
jgi:hypothetical protein